MGRSGAGLSVTRQSHDPRLHLEAAGQTRGQSLTQALLLAPFGTPLPTGILALLSCHVGPPLSWDSPRPSPCSVPAAVHRPTARPCTLGSIRAATAPVGADALQLYQLLTALVLCSGPTVLCSAPQLPITEADGFWSAEAAAARGSLCKVVGVVREGFPRVFEHEYLEG